VEDAEGKSVKKLELPMAIDGIPSWFISAFPLETPVGRLDQAHMVLTYYPEPGAVPLVLDNLNKRILTANTRTDLAPVYSFNGDGLWLAKSRGKGMRVGTSKRINLWQDLKARMKRENGNNEN